MDLPEGGYSDPKGVWGWLPSRARKSPRSVVGAFPAKTLPPGEPAERGGHRTLERTEMALPEKRAPREGGTIVFRDQSGFFLPPMVVRAYAPVGKTPILHERLTRDHL